MAQSPGDGNVTGLVAPLADVGEADATAVGGKAFGLSRLAQGAFEVPSAFCISCAAYRQFMEQTGLENLINARKDRIASADIKDARKLSAELTDHLMQSTMPADLEAEIVASYKRLVGSDISKHVAVRSSPAVSLPGQYHTALNVAGEDHVLDAVKDVWASYWTPEAIVTRGALSVPHTPVQFGVVVQEMIDAEVAGILFTAEMPSGDESKIVIEAVTGLAETLALGRRDPDRFVVDKASLDVIERIAAPAGGSNKTEAVTETLSDQLISELCRIGLSVEKNFQHPVDMEWAYREGRFYTLQARAIRGLADEDVIEPCRDHFQYNPRPPRSDAVWSRYYGDNFLRGRFTPAGYSFVIWWPEAMETIIDRTRGYKELENVPLFRYYRGRAYTNTDYLKLRVQYEPPFLRTQESMNHFPSWEREEIASMPFRWWKRLWGELRVLVLRPNQSLFRNYHFFERESADILDKIRTELDPIDLNASLEELLRYRDVLRRLIARHELGYVGWIFHYKLMIDALLTMLLKEWYGPGHEELFASLQAGVPDNISVKTAGAMWEVSRVAAGDPVVARAFERIDTKDLLDELKGVPQAETFLNALSGFLDEYGYRREALTIEPPSWEEDPTQVIRILKAIVKLPDDRSPTSELEAQIQRRLEATAKVERALSSQRWGWFKKRAFRAVQKYSLAYLACRENQRKVADPCISRYRRMFLAFGDRLVPRGALSDRVDVFFLSEPEILEAVMDDGRAEYCKNKVQSRKATFPSYEALPPMFVRGKSEELLPEAVASRHATDGQLVLEGTPASPGVASGPARILHRLDEVDSLTLGDVLVASAIDPGWTSAFPVIGAVITEIGGALSHGAIMAREFGVPAVIGVEGALTALKDGQSVTVDGLNGTVTVDES
ncbi:MAG: hypothetical protein IH957_00655 [Chloroflexi bacterium]|nr:hypothetical protein [Chloroflexota bacterium]